MTLRVVSVQRNIGVSIAWIAVLYTLPLFGFIAYILLGEPMIGRRYRQRVDQASLLMDDMSRMEGAFLSELNHEFAKKMNPREEEKEQ